MCIPRNGETEEAILMDALAIDMEENDKFVNENGEEVNLSYTYRENYVVVDGDEIHIKKFMDEMYGKKIKPVCKKCNGNGFIGKRDGEMILKEPCPCQK